MTQKNWETFTKNFDAVFSFWNELLNDKNQKLSIKNEHRSKKFNPGTARSELMLCTGIKREVENRYLLTFDFREAIFTALFYEDLYCIFEKSSVFSSFQSKMETIKTKFVRGILTEFTISSGEKNEFN